MAEVETAPAPVAEAPAAVTAPTWRDSLPDDLKADQTLASIKATTANEALGVMAKMTVEAQKKIGAKAAPTVPGAQATPEEIKAWRNALGVPETPAGYTPKAHPLMAHPEWNKEAQGAFLKLAHELHMPPASVDRILGFYGDFVASQLKSNDQVAVEAKGELVKDWGVNYDAYLGAANNGMNRVAKELGVQPGDIFEATKGSDPALVARVFHWMESQFTEHGWVSGEPTRGTTPEEAVVRLGELQQELLKFPQGSPQALEIIEKISNMGRALRAA